MTIWVDADGCPVIREIEQTARRYAIRVVLLCDTNHVLHSGYSEIVVIGAGADAVDFALVNRCQAGDIVVTQDYGVAALALGKGARALSQNGLAYTADNIDRLLFERFLGGRVRRAGGRTRGPKKRTAREDEAFRAALIALLDAAQRAAPPLSGNPSGKDAQPD